MRLPHKNPMFNHPRHRAVALGADRPAPQRLLVHAEPREPTDSDHLAARQHRRDRLRRYVLRCRTRQSDRAGRRHRQPGSDRSRYASIKAIPGFSTATPDPTGGHGDGTTSAIAHKGLLFAIDRTNLRLDVVDPAAGEIIKSTALITSPDYIRYVPPTNELWVTEKGASQIEVFSLSNEPVPQPSRQR